MTTCRISEILSPAFYDAHRAIKRGAVDELVCKGGRGSTKSSFVSVELLLMLMRQSDCHALVLRKVSKTLRSSVYAQIVWALQKMGVASKFKCTVSPMEITYLPTGQKIMFMGLDDPGKVKSIKVPFGYIGILWLEEADQFAGMEEVRSVEQSVFRGGPFSFLFLSYNPPAMARSWVNRYALEARAGKLVHTSDYRSVPPEWLGPRFFADAARLEALHPLAYRHEYLGEVVGCGTEVFSNLDLHPISDNEIKGFDRIHNGLDWGFYPDPWAFNRCHYDAARRTLYIFDEATRHRAGNRETAAVVMGRIDPGELVTADSAEPKSVADYQSAGIRCRGAKKGPGSVEYSMKWLQALDAIVIDPARCPDTTREFSEYEYERDKDGDVQPDYPDINNHHIDAVRYAMEPEWKRRGK